MKEKYCTFLKFFNIFFFQELLIDYSVRPTILIPLWKVAGFTLGAGKYLIPLWKVVQKIFLNRKDNLRVLRSVIGNIL